MDEITKKLAKAWEDLPTKLQNFITQSPWEDRLTEISKQHNLNDDQAYLLKIEVALILFGLENPRDFPMNVRETLPGAPTNEITANIQQQILSEPREELLKFNEQLETQDTRLNEEIKKLPTDLQQAIRMVDENDTLQKIGERHNLHIDQLGQLDNALWQVLLGLEPSVNFVKNVEERLKVNHETAENIARDAEAEIFSKVRESLKQIAENRHTPKPEELLHELESHSSPAAKAPSILERKLSEPVNQKPAEPPPPTPSIVPIKKVDPYLEPVDRE